MATCGQKTEVFSRVCGYYRPVENWNAGKREEFKERRPFRATPRAPAKGRSLPVASTPRALDSRELALGRG